MEAHIKNYVKYFKIDLQDWVACECGCGKRAEQFHHLIPRSSFGSTQKKKQDAVENVAYINHECHERVHRIPASNNLLKSAHRKHLLKNSNNPDDLERYLDKDQGTIYY